jgi:hypothetical protein
MTKSFGHGGHLVPLPIRCPQHRLNRRAWVVNGVEGCSSAVDCLCGNKELASMYGEVDGARDRVVEEFS